MKATLLRQLESFPRQRLAHTPTPLEPMKRLSQLVEGVNLYVKRDDCTGLGFGGNKVRQLEYYIGQAVAENADTVLITGAVQSNFVRAAAAAANHVGMQCHIQLEERVRGVDSLHRSSGNVLLSRLLGASLHSYPDGEDESGADASLDRIAGRLRLQGARPYVIPLGPNHAPLGALGYVDASLELLAQLEHQSLKLDHLIVTSGSGATHTGLLFGLKACESTVAIHGVCPRRNAETQTGRIQEKLRQVEEMLQMESRTCPADVRLTDISLAPGYGCLNDATLEALNVTARMEGLFLDPVYTAKAMAGLFHLARRGEISGNVLFWHTGGQPALFGYGDSVCADPPYGDLVTCVDRP